MLSEIPDGIHCFVDANIICYYLVETPPLSEHCVKFIKRVERGAITASTSGACIAEAIHKVMLAEAIAREGLEHRGLAHRLQKRRELIGGLSEHRKVPVLVQALNLHLEPITIDLLARASEISQQALLLTNDSLTVAVMEKLGLVDLVTNDDNFDAVSGLTVWQPR
jgi:predicted nucleic acid-binding protein